MLVMVSMLELAAAVQGGTCDASHWTPGAGSWEPIQQERQTGGTAQACCEAAGAAAWTYYPFRKPHTKSICVIATGDGTRQRRAGAPQSMTRA